MEFVLVLDTASYHANIFSNFDYEDENDDEDDWNKPVHRNPQPPQMTNEY